MERRESNPRRIPAEPSVPTGWPDSRSGVPRARRRSASFGSRGRRAVGRQRPVDELHPGRIRQAVGSPLRVGADACVHGGIVTRLDYRSLLGTRSDFARSLISQSRASSRLGEASLPPIQGVEPRAKRLVGGPQSVNRGHIVVRGLTWATSCRPRPVEVLFPSSPTYSVVTITGIPGR